MILLQIDMDAAIFLNVVGDGVDWLRMAMGLYLQPPSVYFVGLAVVVAAAGVARRYVPMKRK